MSMRTIKGKRSREPRLRGYRTAGVQRAASALEVMQRQAAQERQQDEVRRIAQIQAEVLAEAAETCGYRFAGLELVEQDPAAVRRFRDGMVAAMKGALAPLVGREDTPDLRAEAAAREAEAVAAYYQVAVDAGAVRPRNVRLAEAPRCRVYPGGRVEVCREGDADVRGIAARLRERLRPGATAEGAN